MFKNSFCFNTFSLYIFFMLIQTVSVSYICTCLDKTNCGTDLNTCERVFIMLNITKSDLCPQRYGFVCKRSTLLGIKNFCEGEYGCILPRIQILKEKSEIDIPVYLNRIVVQTNQITGSMVLNAFQPFEQQNHVWYADVNDRIAKTFNFSLLGWRETYTGYQPLGNLSGICLNNYLNYTNNILVLNQSEYLFICFKNIYSMVNRQKIFFNENFAFRCYSRYYQNDSVSFLQDKTVYLNKTQILEVAFFPPDNYSNKTEEYNDIIQTDTSLFIYILFSLCFLSILVNIILIYKTCAKKKNQYVELINEMQNINSS